MRKDIMSVLDLFREKGYACGYLTTNGTIITEERAEALADLAAAGFLKHISVSIDGPSELHDVARGLKGTFERTTEGLRRLQEAARRKRRAAARQHQHDRGAREPRRARPDGRRRRGARRRRHRPQPPDVQHAGGSRRDRADDRRRRRVGDRHVRHAGSRPRRRARSATQGRRARGEVPASGTSCSTSAPRCTPQLMDSYYTPGTQARRPLPLSVPARARVVLAARSIFCPFIRVEVGDLTESSLEEVWNGERYVEMRRRLLEHGIFPVCRRCCKVELSPVPAVATAGHRRARRAIPVTVVRACDARTAHAARQPAARQRRRLHAPGPLPGARGSARHDQAALHARAAAPRCCATRGCDVRLVDLTAERRIDRRSDRAARRAKASRRR